MTEKKILRSVNIEINAFVIFLIAIIAVPYTAFSTSNPKSDRIKEIETKIKRDKAKLKKFGTKEKDLLRGLSDLQKEVAEKRKLVDDLETKMRSVNTEVMGLKKKLSVIEIQIKRAKSEREKRLVVLYKYARGGYITVLANANDPAEFWKRLKYLRAILELDHGVLRKLADDQNKYMTEAIRIKGLLAKREQTKKEEILRMASLRKDLEKKTHELEYIHREKAFYEKTVKELQQEADSLRHALANLEKREPYHQIQASSHFEEAKGKLPFPVEGRIIRSDKIIGAAGRRLRKGIFIQGDSDADKQVISVFPGRVDFSGRLKGYGEMIIINHGSRFFTVTALLSQRNRKEGDVVNVGDIIGLSGRDFSSRGSLLYFEVRKAGKNLDPAKWLINP